MPRFAIAHRVTGSPEPATYYCIDGLGRISRVGTSAKATVWDTELKTRQAMEELGLSGDPDVFVSDVSGPVQ
jgi:hypothetical protein